jgi:hypothetical protein
MDGQVPLAPKMDKERPQTMDDQVSELDVRLQVTRTPSMDRARPEQQDKGNQKISLLF